MCGIIALAGKNTKKISDEKIQAMLAYIEKRGPDDRGFERAGDAVIGMNRLAIVDLSPAGHQPMKDNEGPYTIVFNGEIYGYKDLRAELERKGHAFRSHSDTEVILKAYAEYGEACLDRLDGMFAFAIWDDQKKQLFVARDRFGKKPFYYTFVDGVFIAASETKAIFASGLVKGSIDKAAIAEYLRLGYIPPYRTVYSNIGTLPPAHAGIVKDGTIKTWRYWRLEKKPISPTYKEAKAEIKRLFAKAVEKRMVADVEVGSLLSGGIDSTIVTLEAQKHMDRPIKTFSVGYGSTKDELPYAKTVSDKIGTDHHTLVAAEPSLKELEEVIAYFDEPHADSSDFPQHLVSKLAGSKVKVALTGDGADELFMGYGWYQKHWHTPLPQRLFRTKFGSYKRATEVFSPSEIHTLVKTVPELDRTYELASLAGANGGIAKINAFDLNIYLPGQLLTKVDRTSMMHSLEVRSPFLDTELAEYVYNLPAEFKLSKNENKIILKDILAEVFPKEFVYRRKQGFGAPMKEWLKDSAVKKRMADVLADASHPLFNYVDRAKAAKVTGEYRIWTLLSLALWLELHKKDYE